jgi:polyphosphate kinase
MNLKDNFNSYKMLENGNYEVIKPKKDDIVINIHKEFFHVNLENVLKTTLF